MDDDRRLSAARVTELGQVNQAFLTSIDESDHGHQEIGLKIMSLLPNGNSESCHFTKTNCNEDDSWLSSSPVSSVKPTKLENMDDDEDIKAADGNFTSFIDGKNGTCCEEASTIKPYGVTSCQPSQPNQVHQCYDLDLNNSTSTAFSSSFDDLMSAKPQERMKEDIGAHIKKPEKPGPLVEEREKGISKGVSDNEFTAIDLGLHKDESQDGGNMKNVPCDVSQPEIVKGQVHDNSTLEVGDLDISIRSDATEFFYTPDISPSRSPITSYVEHKKGVKFCEKRIEIGQDMLESSFDQLDENALVEERVVGCLDQEYLRRLVDPNSQFFVCT